MFFAFIGTNESDSIDRVVSIFQLYYKEAYRLYKTSLHFGLRDTEPRKQTTETRNERKKKIIDNLNGNYAIAVRYCNRIGMQTPLKILQLHLGPKCMQILKSENLMKQNKHGKAIFIFSSILICHTASTFDES